MINLAYVPKKPKVISSKSSLRGRDDLFTQVAKILDWRIGWGWENSEFVNQSLNFIWFDPNETLSTWRVEWLPQSAKLELIRFYVTGLAKTNPKLAHQLLNDEWNRQHITTDSALVHTGDAVYSVFQNIHGDVSLEQILLPHSQSELFTSDWYDIVWSESSQIGMYQQTTSFVTVLLLAYRLWGWELQEIQDALSSFDKKINMPNVGDLWMSESSITFFSRCLLSIKDWKQSNKYGILPLEIKYGYEYESVYNAWFDVKTNMLYIWTIKRPKSVDEEISRTVRMGIAVEHIPHILSKLCRLPGRSWFGPAMLLKAYLEIFSK